MPRLIKVPFVEPRSSKVLSVRECNSRMTPRDLRLGVIRVQIYVRKIPPSASTSMCASTSFSMNCFHSNALFYTNRACGWQVLSMHQVQACRNVRQQTRPLTWSGSANRFSVAIFMNLLAESMVPFGLRGHRSSQYCEPSKFSVLHRSQVIIGS